jgi:voltage-gated potassium channel
MIGWTVLRVIGSIAVLVTVYYQLPLQTSSTAIAITILLIGLVLLIALIAWQVRSILASSFPGVRAVEALATSVPLFLLLFASSYAVMARLSAANFSEPLDRTNALYFTVTVFSTVGFGDITATSHTARLVVTGQMIADLVVIGIAIQAIVGAAKRKRNP